MLPIKANVPQESMPSLLPQPDVDGMSMLEDLIPIDLGLRIN